MKKSQTNAKCFKILRFIHTFCVIFARLAIKSAKNACSTTNILHNLHKNWLSQLIFQSSSNFSLAFPFTSPSFPLLSDALFECSQCYLNAFPLPTLRLCYKGKVSHNTGGKHRVGILKAYLRVCLETGYSKARSSLGAG